jgi:hypothetical protein
MSRPCNPTIRNSGFVKRDVHLFLLVTLKKGNLAEGFRSKDRFLAKRESVEPFRSEGRFLAAPVDAVKFLAEQMKPVKALDPKRVERLLADLGSDDFASREAASKALAGLDEQATPYLEAALKSTETPEVRVRVTRLLEQSRRAAIPAERIRQIRAVMVLERIGDGEAKTLLKRWAGGPAGARLTMEAAAALKRVEAMTKTNR